MLIYVCFFKKQAKSIRISCFWDKKRNMTIPSYPFLNYVRFCIVSFLALSFLYMGATFGIYAIYGTILFFMHILSAQDNPYSASFR